MNKRLTTVERSLATPPVIKRQRLQRFANVIRSSPPVPLHLFINLEYRDAGEWDYLAHPSSAFALAAKDSLLHDAGLTGDYVTRTGSSIFPGRNWLISHVYVAPKQNCAA